MLPLICSPVVLFYSHIPSTPFPFLLLSFSFFYCQQIPRIDINAPSNAIELDPNVAALYGEGVADSGDECGEGSAGEEEVRIKCKRTAHSER